MIRVCTLCGAKVGTKHKRNKIFIWKKKPRNLIQEKKDAIQITIGGNRV